MLRQPVLTLVGAASLSLAAASAEAASCAQLLTRGGRIIDTYVMDFGQSDKLYVYILRLPDGRADKCTSTRKLTS